MLILVVGDMFGDVIIWNVMKGEFKLMFFGNGWLVWGKLKIINFLFKLV